MCTLALFLLLRDSGSWERSGEGVGDAKREHPVWLLTFPPRSPYRQRKPVHLDHVSVAPTRFPWRISPSPLPSGLAPAPAVTVHSWLFSLLLHASSSFSGLSPYLLLALPLPSRSSSPTSFAHSPPTHHFSLKPVSPCLLHLFIVFHLSLQKLSPFFRPQPLLFKTIQTHLL